MRIIEEEVEEEGLLSIPVNSFKRGVWGVTQTTR